MTKFLALASVAAALSLGACTAQEQRAGGGALIGAATGAAIGGLATGRGSGAAAGALIGGASGAIIGAGTAPADPCPYGSYRDRYGNIYCR